MKKYFFKCTFLITVFIIIISGCVSSPGKDGVDVQTLKKKITVEFDEYIGEKNFYGACKSFIEFTISFEGEKKDEMARELTELLHGKIAELRNDNDTLKIIEYTYSYINLMKGTISDEKLSSLEEDLFINIQDYVSSELTGMGQLERASWLIYLTNISPDNPFLYKLLVEVFLERNNPLLAEKYFSAYTDAVETDEPSGYEDELEELKNKIDELKIKSGEGTGIPQIAIEGTIKSSVKIIVDKGIKTENRVGRPDQILGTGVVIDENGYVITNYHIIESSVDPKYEGYSKVYVIPGKDDNVRFVAKIIGYDPIYDLALLKIEKSLESNIRFGDSSALRQGEGVTAIGNPVGLTNTVTSGVVSSLDRPFLQIGNIIQIDAALNPGNSGGALINNDGYLVGIAFAGLESFENLNFAIPSNLLLSLLFRLYREGNVERSWMGCVIGKQDDYLTIDYIVPGGPSGPSRLSVGDIILEVNGKPAGEIFDVQNFTSYLDNPLIINLTIERDNRVEVKNILLDVRPELPSLYVYNHDAKENIITPLFGIVTTRVDPPRKKIHLVSRVVTGSVARSVGISEGDVIKMKGIKYDEENRVFLLLIDLKSKRFGYVNKSMVLFSPADINTFI